MLTFEKLTTFENQWPVNQRKKTGKITPFGEGKFLAFLRFGLLQVFCWDISGFSEQFAT
jgi:hypothetical protein